MGLRDAGYKTVSVDDCWAKSRDPTTNVIQADPVTFPSGMKALADYAHARGLKFGLYSSNSPKTCAGRPGSFGFEYLDAQTYASWGVDLLKYDNCGNQDIIGPPERGYAVMRDALNASGRPIFFAACEWAVDFPSTWMAPVANSWRTTYDVQNSWECVLPHVDWTNVYAKYSGPGHFADMDILEVGNGVLTPAEERAHMSLWAIMKSPLLIGCDLSTPGCTAALPLFLNKGLLAISQDALGVQATRLASWGVQGLPFGKSGKCGTEELPQNTVIAPCDPKDPLQQWTILANGTIKNGARGECLQLDSGQGGCCSQAWEVWTNNVASAMCNDPASCCASHQELWQRTPEGLLINNASGQCLTVHAGGMVNVGASPCTLALQGLQTWDYRGDTGQFVSSASPPGSTTPSCLARTPDVQGGAQEVWGGPLAGGDRVALFFNRNDVGGVNITADVTLLGFLPGASVKVYDVLGDVDLGVATGEVTATGVGVHDVSVYRLSLA